MTHAPRQGSGQTATHVAQLECKHLDGDRYLCTGALGDGSRLSIDVVVSRDGKDFRYERP